MLVFLVIALAACLEPAQQVIFAGSGIVSPTPSPPSRNDVVDAFRRRVQRLADRVRAKSDEEDVVDKIDDLEKDFEDLCDDLFGGTDRKKCEDLIEQKAKNARDAADRHADAAKKKAKKEKKFLKERKKDRESDAEPFVEEYEDILKEKFGRRGKDVDDLDLIQLVDGFHFLREAKVVFIKRCLAGMEGGRSGACSGQIERLTKEIMPKLREEMEKQKKKVRKAQKKLDKEAEKRAKRLNDDDDD